MISNLEPGCTAIIIGGVCEENIGKIVTIGKFIGEFIDCKNKDMWEVNKPILFRRVRSKEEIVLYLCSDKTMQRIDDHKIQETEKEEFELTA